MFEVGSAFVTSLLSNGLKCSLRLSQGCTFVQTALNLAGHYHIMSMGELLAGLPSEVRVHIFCLALGLPAPLRHWLNCALVSQCLRESLSVV